MTREHAVGCRCASHNLFTSFFIPSFMSRKLSFCLLALRLPCPHRKGQTLRQKSCSKIITSNRTANTSTGKALVVFSLSPSLMFLVTSTPLHTPFNKSPNLHIKHVKAKRVKMALVSITSSMIGSRHNRQKKASAATYDRAA